MKEIKHSRNVIEIALIVLICIFVLWLGANQVMSQVKDQMTDEMSAVEKSLTNVSDLYNKADANQERVHKHLARLGAYYLNNSEDPLSKKTLENTRDILDVKDVYVLNEAGKILQSSGSRDNDAIPSIIREALLNVSSKHPYSLGLVMGEKGDETDDAADPEDTRSAADSGLVAYTSRYIKPGYIFVICDNYIDYNASFSSDNGLYDIIKRSHFGKNGFFFMLLPDGKLSFSSLDADYFNETEKLDVPKNGFHDGYSSFFTIDGNNYFCTIKSMDGTNVFLGCALPVKELAVALLIICGTSILVLLGALLLIYTYAYNIVLESSKKKNRQAELRSFRTRLSVLTLLCIIVTSGITVYINTLYIYSYSLSSNVSKAGELQETIAPLDEIQELGSDQYQKTVKAFTKTAAALISDEPAFREREKLEKLADTLCADHILVYDESGKVIASDQNYTGLTLSDDPEDLSYDFRWVIRGEPLLIQEKVDSEYLHKRYMFSGASLKDENGECTGLVQLAIPPSFHGDIVIMTSIESILSSFYDGGQTIPFAVDIETQKVYSAYEPFNNLRVKELGFKEDELTDEYTGFYDLQSQMLLGNTKTSGNYWTVMASFTEDYPLHGVINSLPVLLASILAEILFLIFLFFRMKDANGLIKADRAALFDNKKISEARAETHIIRLVSDTAIVFAALVSLTVFFGPVLFQKETPGYYIFTYPWEKGFNIFIFTSCLIIICIVAFTMSIIMKLLRLLASLLSSRHETIIRLIISFLKDFGWIGAFYYCLTLLGVPTVSLLASAGALTAIFSIGAQNIVADILAGLFIIFEGSFKVGDMITVDDWHGQVQEIGIRNTTIRDLISNDVKILNNSTIKRVINNSVYPSFCAMKIGIPYGMDLTELEEIIEKEIPVMQEDLAGRIEAFRYLGVDEFADSSVIIKFEVACRNQDFLKVKRALNREIKLMFDRNGINVPFPQVVLHDEK